MKSPNPTPGPLIDLVSQHLCQTTTVYDTSHIPPTITLSTVTQVQQLLLAAAQLQDESLELSTLAVHTTGELDTTDAVPARPPGLGFLGGWLLCGCISPGLLERCTRLYTR